MDRQQYLDAITLFVIEHRTDLEKEKPLDQWTVQEIMKVYVQWQLYCLDQITVDQVINELEEITIND